MTYSLFEYINLELWSINTYIHCMSSRKSTYFLVITKKAHVGNMNPMHLDYYYICDNNQTPGKTTKCTPENQYWEFSGQWMQPFQCVSQHTWLRFSFCNSYLFYFFKWRWYRRHESTEREERGEEAWNHPTHGFCMVRGWGASESTKWSKRYRIKNFNFFIYIFI